MDSEDPLPLAYASPTPTVKRRRALVWIALALLIVQLPWIMFWMLWQRNVLEDGSIKRPFPEFFIHIGIAVPAILAIGASVLHCQREYRLYASLRNCKLSICIAVLALLFVALAVYGWYMDDIVYGAVSHGVW